MNRHLVQFAISINVALLAAHCSSGGGGDDGGATGEEAWQDDTSGLAWQNPASDKVLTNDEATSYCEGLSWDGHDDWRLPTIGEIRSLIRGCPNTQAGGACGVTDSCLETDCFLSSCGSCSDTEGPGEDGCFWDAALAGHCLTYWSSSIYAGESGYRWIIDFNWSYVAKASKTNAYLVRCVRGP